MDELKIKSGLIRSVVGKLVGRLVREKLGIDCFDIFLSDAEIKIDGEKARVHLNTDFELSATDLNRLLTQAGL